jgi:CRP/FNR family transcriptional regulator, anaerobic regulatory protein
MNQQLKAAVIGAGNIGTATSANHINGYRLHCTVEPLLLYFDQFIPLSNEEKEQVAAKFHHRLFNKHQLVLQEGDLSTQLYFVIRGLLRSYHVDDKGSICILQFAPENYWIYDVGSFHQKRPSALNIDALEDTIVLHTSYEELTTLFTAIPKLDRIFRILNENGYIGMQERLMQNISCTAKERYESFLDAYPHLVNRLSQVQIAAFLGITPEFLSRLRGQSPKTSK